MPPAKVKSLHETNTAPTKGPGVEAVLSSGLPALLTKIDSGPFGTTVGNIRLLEEVARAVDQALHGREDLLYHLSAPQKDSAELTPLTREQLQLSGYFAMIVFCRYLRHTLSLLVDLPNVSGQLSSEGLADLAEEEPAPLAARLTRLLTLFIAHDIEQPKADPAPKNSVGAETVGIFATLLARAVDEISNRGRVGRLKELCENHRTSIDGVRWRGFAPEEVADTSNSQLRPVEPEDIVGNTEYLHAALRLARDVAGYDFKEGRNPKQLNPIAFALGAPGCGKTLVAHAVGNYFNRFCAERDIRSKFVVIQRSDWASSYQNASAGNLIRIFKELQAFDGVVGIYWADIDTALASRDQQGLRSEEKANLSAAFNIFDGTLIPFNGKWFMLCDANNLEMDEALRTRIAKNPFQASGPKSTEDYIRLLREIMLKEFNSHIKADDTAWTDIGKRASDARISGRGMEGISRQIIDRIQDFEYPEAYYEADFAERQRILASCSKEISGASVLDLLERYIGFEQAEEQRVAKERFENAVNDAVFALGVQRETVSRLTSPDGAAS